MNDNHEHDNQASELKSLFEEVQKNESSMQRDRKEKEVEQTTDIREIDLLNLPPRKEVHGKDNKWTRLKISKPLRRLLFVTVVLLVLFGFIYYFWNEIFIDIFFHL